jgi:hypothetical protein
VPNPIAGTVTFFAAMVSIVVLPHRSPYRDAGLCDAVMLARALHMLNVVGLKEVRIF